MSGWHSQSAREVLAGLETDGQRGLTRQEAARRLERYGPNTLEQGKRRSMALRLLDQLRDPMVLVLLGAAGLSLLVSSGEDWLDAAIILLIVVVNAAISISQEDGAQRALEALRRMSAPRAKVIREGAVALVPAEELVPGDLVVLEAGDLVPADGRILESTALRCDESAMTGESAPVSKGAGAVLAEDTPLADRSNMVVGATVVTAGHALCAVTATGMDSEVGRIAGMLLLQERGETPLQKKMAEVSGTLSFVCLCVCGVMFGVGLLFHKPVFEMFMTAVSLAVAAIPEGLPAIVTIVLAMGVQRMVNRHAIVKRLPAVETLGCAGVICSDKTGTLTQNRMKVVDLWTLRPGQRTLALEIGALCSDVHLERDGRGKAVCTGDPTETALVELALGEGVDKNVWEETRPRRGRCPLTRSGS